MAEGETLWDIARQYRTDEEAIRAANELTEDRPEGMLLIPRLRPPPHIFYFPGPDDKFSVTGAKQGYTTGETCDMIDE